MFTRELSRAVDEYSEKSRDLAAHLRGLATAIENIKTNEDTEAAISLGRALWPKIRERFDCGQRENALVDAIVTRFGGGQKDAN